MVEECDGRAEKERGDGRKKDGTEGEEWPSDLKGGAHKGREKTVSL